MLTRKQHELLMFINTRLSQSGVSPSFDEMKDALGLKSKSGIHRLITGLEERGFIRRLPHRARALEVVRLPDDTTSNGLAAKARGGFSPQIIEGGVGKAASVDADAAETIELPLLGKIAAGTPIEALSDPTRQVGVPGAMVGKGEYYCLEVEGDSMVEAGILDGDTVVIRRSDKADNGKIVVALVEGSEVTLKRLRRRNNSVALEPANAAYETRIFGPDQVQIQGELVGLMRNY